MKVPLKGRNQGINKGRNPEDSTEGTLKRKRDEEESSSYDVAAKGRTSQE